MGWFWKSLKGMIDPRASGESIIERSEANYRQSEQMSRGAEPHYILMHVYVTRMATHGKNPHNPVVQAEGLTKTFEYACLPFAKNIRALGIYFIQFERPDIIQQCPEFDWEYSELMAPITDARQQDQLGALYRKYNPTIGRDERQ